MPPPQSITDSDTIHVLVHPPIMAAPKNTNQAAKAAQAAVIGASQHAVTDINRFTRKVLVTRGGRMGSGMGTLLESLWGYAVNRQLKDRFGDTIELAWLADHEYNDFAVVTRNAPWASATREGELFRIEAKSMVVGADESKAHFDEIEKNLGEFDLLLILVWAWEKHQGDRVQPVIRGLCLSPARAVARVRDALHVARGGRFVERSKCPDKCAASDCPHHGEPLNASGKRERVSGPETCRVSSKVSFAANFGGMVRMLKTDSPEARTILRRLRAEDPDINAFVSFIHTFFPGEELNQFSIAEWRQIAEHCGVAAAGLDKAAIADLVRSGDPQYQSKIVKLFAPPKK